MKKIFEVHIKQTCILYNKSFFRKINIDEIDAEENTKKRIIFALNKDDAIKQYEERYKINYGEFLGICCGYYGMRSYSYMKNLKNEIICHEVNCYSFDYLKEHMRSCDFIEYCKQELYPIEVIMR